VEVNIRAQPRPTFFFFFFLSSSSSVQPHWYPRRPDSLLPPHAAGGASAVSPLLPLRTAPTAGPPPSRPPAPASSPHPNPKFYSSSSPATPRPAASSPYPMRSCPDLRRGAADHSGHLAVRRGQLAVCPHHHRIIRQGMSVLHFPDSATLVRYTCLYVRGIECRCACPRICSRVNS
jgi:hypothetical protein